jgi:hypothetical protein
LGAEQLERWWVAVERAMEFREKMGDERFADVTFSELQTDPVAALAGALGQIGVPFGEASRSSVEKWARSHEPGSHGTHTYELSAFGLDADQINERFASYCDTFGIEGQATD